MYWLILGKYPADELQAAVIKHIEDPKSGSFMPKPADILKHINGEEITVESIIAAARLATTPLGCLARIQIGSWDLDNQNDFYLKQRAEECLQLLPDWKLRAKSGDYSKHEAKVMLSRGVMPAAPFYLGFDARAKGQEIRASMDRERLALHK